MSKKINFNLINVHKLKDMSDDKLKYCFYLLKEEFANRCNSSLVSRYKSRLIDEPRNHNE